jgi:hypothetical protein
MPYPTLKPLQSVEDHTGKYMHNRVDLEMSLGIDSGVSLSLPTYLSRLTRGRLGRGSQS